jgi:hypothetical protein
VPPPAPGCTGRTSRPTWKKQEEDQRRAKENEAKEQHQKAKEENQKEKEPEQKLIAEETADPDRGQIAAHLAYQAAYGPYTPETYVEAIRSPQADEWMKAMQEELDMLGARETWVKEKLPSGQKEVGCRWVFLIKFDAEGNITHYKARLVAQGFSQKPGVDFYDTFSPTANQATLNVLWHISASFRWYRAQDNVTGAFLHSDLDSEIYMRQPPGFNDGSRLSLRLKRSLYGPKQASHLWNKYMDERLKTIGFKPIQSDQSVYVRDWKDKRVIIAVHVDNMHSISNSEKELKHAQHQLHELFEMKEEDPNWFMGYQLIPDVENGTISISQHHYINSLLECFNMKESNPRTLPVTPGAHLSKDNGPENEEQKKRMEKVPYWELVGGLLWASRISRPDTSFGTGYFGRFSSNPGQSHWSTTQNCLKFLGGTINRKLILGNSDPDKAMELIGYSDADFAREEDDQRSVSGYLFQLSGQTILWGSKKQSIVACSSTEAEYIAVAHTVGEGLWLRNLLKELGFGPKGPTILNVNNKSTIAIIERPKQQQTKHIDIKYHFI